MPEWERRCGDCDWPPGFFLSPTGRDSDSVGPGNPHLILPGAGTPHLTGVKPQRRARRTDPLGCCRLRHTKAGSTSASAWPGALSSTLEAPQLSGSPDLKLVGGGSDLGIPRVCAPRDGKVARRNTFEIESTIAVWKRNST